MNYLYCPRGPQSASNQQPATCDRFVGEFLEKAAGIARKEQSIFLRWDPPYEKNFRGLSAIRYQLKAAKSVQPRHTIWMDLTKTDDELLSGMHEKTRYNIRLAERKGVVVKTVSGRENIEIFWKLLQQTTERDAFGAHTKIHYEKLIGIFGKASHVIASETKQSRTDVKIAASSHDDGTPRNDTREPFTNLYIAEYQGQQLAAAIVMFCNDTVAYLHGASSNEHRNVMAPYLLHWRIMQDAKALGLKTYDLWGIDDNNPHWAGITRFKRGFCGREVSYPNSIDILYKSVWYAAYKIARRLVA